MKHIGLLGGTFDPIHEGHLHIAQEVQSKLSLDHIQFIPCFQPPHRTAPKANPEDRLIMVQLAIKNNPLFSVNPIELERKGPSYAIDTVKALANLQQIFYFIVGIDSFLQFDHWHQWQDILKYCHLIVVNRPQYDFILSPSLETFYQQHHSNDIAQDERKHSGYIFNLTIKPCEYSATLIRQAISRRQTSIPGLPQAVLDYIQKNRLYCSNEPFSL